MGDTLKRLHALRTAGSVLPESTLLVFSRGVRSTGQLRESLRDVSCSMHYDPDAPTTPEQLLLRFVATGASEIVDIIPVECAGCYRPFGGVAVYACRRCKCVAYCDRRCETLGMAAHRRGCRTLRSLTNNNGARVSRIRKTEKIDDLTADLSSWTVQ